MATIVEDVDLGDDDGYVNLKLGDVMNRLDVWDVNNQILDYHARNKGKPDREYNAGLVDLVKSLGYPQVSHKLAFKFVDKLQELARAVKKKEDPSAVLPASTASTLGS